MKVKKAITIILILLLALSLVFLLSPFMARDRSLGIMKIYDRYQDHHGLPKKEGILVDMPFEQMDFYPLMVTYNDGPGLSKFLGKPVDFTVEYTFADFPQFKSRSSIYNESHPLYNAYLGVYYVKGYNDMLTQEDALRVASYDATHLALPAVGLDSKDAIFQVNDINKTSENIKFGQRDWILYTSQITTNSHRHSSGDFTPGDLQFGKSPDSEEDYPLIQMEGRLYLTYLEEIDINLCIYVIVRDHKTADLIHEKIILNTVLELKKRP